MNKILTLINSSLTPHINPEPWRTTSAWRDILKKFTYSSCSIINISINTHEIHKCPRGEIGRHKGLKSRGIHKLVSPW